MIKFKALIHKETGIVVKYDEWIRLIKSNCTMGFTKKLKISKPLKATSTKTYEPQEMLFSDDFIIVYDSKLRTLELIQLYSNSGELKTKLKKIIDQRHYLEREYNTKLW